MDATRLPEVRLGISVFDNAWDNQPKLREVTLAALVRALTTVRAFPDVTDKRALPAWSPARFSGASRRAVEVVELSSIVLDLDGGDADAVSLAWSPWLHVLHSTWSNTPENPRFRLVAPLAKPVLVAAWSAAWAWATARTPTADPACKDPSRLYFRPAVRSLEQPHFARVVDGDVLDVLPLLLANSPALHHPDAKRARVPARQMAQVVRRRLAQDAGTRERVAGELGAPVVGIGDGRRAEHLPCPLCGRPSVWFLVSPHRQSRAHCDHRKSCGWNGPLESLLGDLP